MEEEARIVLREAVQQDPAPEKRLGTALHELFKPLGGLELELPPREPMREPFRMDRIPTAVVGAGQNVWFYRDFRDGRMEVDVFRFRRRLGHATASSFRRLPLAGAPTRRSTATTPRSGESHQAIHQWCAEQDLVLARPCWELCGDRHDDPARRRTDMYHLPA